MSQTIPAIFRAGVFHPLQPVNWPDGTHAEVTPVLHSAASSTQPGGLVARWPASYFEQTSGALAGEDFERPPQPEFPQREDW